MAVIGEVVACKDDESVLHPRREVFNTIGRSQTASNQTDYTYTPIPRRRRRRDACSNMDMEVTPFSRAKFRESFAKVRSRSAKV